MTLFLANLAAYSAQIACVVGAGGLVTTLLRVRSARIRYAAWRLLLAACLALPFLQSRQSSTGSAEPVAFLTALEPIPSSATIPVPQTSWTPNIPALIVAVLFAGMAVRLLWIGIGLVRLRTRARTGATVRDGGDQVFQRALGTHADIRYLAGLHHPVMFGLLAPIVWLPLELRGGPEKIRQAVLCHELLHVRRRDWAWLVGEEIVRAAFWFHPAIWWLITEIQITREEVVDGLVVAHTRDRRGYMEALVAFSDNTPFTPVAPFGRRRQLVRRIALLSKDVAVSRMRVGLSSAAVALVVLVGTWCAAGAFPLQAKPVGVENPIPRRTHNVTPQYPLEMRGFPFEAKLTVNITLDASGRVVETHFIRGEFRSDPARVPARAVPHQGFPVQVLFQASVDKAVRQWRYETPAVAPMTFPVAFRFTPDHDAVEFKSELAPLGNRPWWHQDAVRAGNGVPSPTLIKNVRPVYPADAAAAGIQGTVVLEVLVGTDGTVRRNRIRVLRSIPQLDQAAIDAVTQWEFSPAVDDPKSFTEPQAVIVEVPIQFTRQ